MARYDDINVRDSLADNGERPSPNPDEWSLSPDIIPFGQDTLTQDQLRETWKKDIGKNLLKARPNNIYVRGFNYGGGAQEGKVYLYYTPMTLMTHPSRWLPVIKDPITIRADADNSIALCSGPIGWTPPNDHEHYCLIARVVTGKHPNHLPDKNMPADEYIKWIKMNPAVCQRNIVIEAGDAPKRGHRLEALVINPDAKVREIFLSADFHRIPKGSEVTLTCKELEINRSKKIDKEADSLAEKTEIGGNFTARLLVTCRLPPESKLFPPGASINVQQYFIRKISAEGLDPLAISPQALGLEGLEGEELLLAGNAELVFDKVPEKP